MKRRKKNEPQQIQKFKNSNDICFRLSILISVGAFQPKKKNAKAHLDSMLSLSRITIFFLFVSTDSDTD